MRKQLWQRSLGGFFALSSVVGVFVGCSEMTAPKGEPQSEFAASAAQIQRALAAEAPPTVPTDWDPGKVHNDILAAFEALHPVQRPLDREGFVAVYVRAAEKALSKNGVRYAVPTGLVTGFLDVFERAVAGHGLDAPQALLETLEREGWLEPEERRAVSRVIQGEPAGALPPALALGARVRAASHAYWLETGRLTQAQGPATEGWFRDLFVIGSDTVGGVLGGLVGAGVGTGLGGPAGGTVGAAVGGPLGAGALSGLAVMTLECACNDS